MSLSTIQSDYTPKDFLQKLLGNKYKDQKSSQLVQQGCHDNGNSQSLSTVSNHNQISVKTPNLKRIHFQSVQNIRSPRKNLTQIQVSEQKKSQGYKQNQNKESLKKQKTPTKIGKYQSSETIDQPQISTKQLTQKTLKNSQQVNLNAKSKDSQNLIIQKALLLLKVTLNGKIRNQEISSILNKIQRGVKNPSQFDQIIKESQNNPNKNQKQINLNNQISLNVKMNRSKSLEIQKAKQNHSLKRYNSQKKKLLISKSQKERRNEISSIKKQILCKIKKMKQLFLLNQKSLKMAKRTCSF